MKNPKNKSKIAMELKNSKHVSAFIVLTTTFSQKRKWTDISKKKKKKYTYEKARNKTKIAIKRKKKLV